ncbi:YceI family protein [Marinicella litoralis]|uniref:Polyisoprenoid-binding protein YceI n=1 Tax=Marinicella litoralis TaxID=644220 RepID=A0A4R6XGP9_9GAMM|nr:YceI family protein [Marinicella litoralis]TDR17459.1 polyisoprenoid-binding protein YceI [Marinicella litoralis]
MNVIKIGLLYFSCLLLVACHQPKVDPAETSMSPINWQLLTSESQLSFVTTKNKTITEEHTIQFHGGYIDDNRQLIVEADLSSVDTNIEIRDQRLKDLLFQVDEFPMATISSQLDRKLPLVEPFTIEFDLDLHGTKKPMTAIVMLQSVGNKLVVTNFEPVFVHAKDFDLDSGINQLTKIAGLQSIDYSVLVDFKLTFEK